VPGQRSYQNDLAVSHNNVGFIQRRGGRMAHAESAFHKALAIQQPLAEADPGDVAVESRLGGMYNNLVRTAAGQYEIKLLLENEHIGASTL
jgi:hypothetical protein